MQDLLNVLPCNNTDGTPPPFHGGAFPHVLDLLGPAREAQPGERAGKLAAGPRVCLQDLESLRLTFSELPLWGLEREANR